MNKIGERMHKAVFLDRDGVLNTEMGTYVSNTDMLQVPAHVPAALKRLQDMGYLLIVVTNQGGIAKGLYTVETLRDIHDKMVSQLLQHGVRIGEIFYCPHHPDFGKCLCRKPGSLMIEKAIARFGIDPAASLMIGDKERDVLAAEAAGVRGAMVESNASWAHVVDELAKENIP